MGVGKAGQSANALTHYNDTEKLEASGNWTTLPERVIILQEEVVFGDWLSIVILNCDPAGSRGGSYLDYQARDQRG